MFRTNVHVRVLLCRHTANGGCVAWLCRVEFNVRRYTASWRGIGIGIGTLSSVLVQRAFEVNNCYCAVSSYTHGNVCKCK